MGAQVAHLLVLVILFVLAPGFLHAYNDEEEVGLDNVKQMTPKELDSLIYNTYMMYQSLKNIAKM